MSDPLYIRLGLTVRGPYSLNDLHELASRGGFSKSHEVSPDKKSWTSASNHPKLFPEVRRPQSLDRHKHSSEPVDPEKIDEGLNSLVPAPTSVQRHFQTEAEQTSGRIAVDGASGLGAGKLVAEKPLSAQTLWAVVLGPLGFILLLVCTAMIVLRLRVAAFLPANNIGLMILLGTDLLVGAAAVTLGHLAINDYLKQPGTVKERNLIVIGLSCGYTVLILSLLFSIVLLISALG